MWVCQRVIDDGTTSAMTETVVSHTRQHKDQGSVIISRVQDTKCTCFIVFCVQKQYNICLSTTKSAVGLVIDACATVRSLVSPLLAVSALTVKTKGCAGRGCALNIVPASTGLVGPCLCLCLSSFLAFTVLGLSAHITDCANLHGYHSGGTPRCRFVRHGKRSSLTVATAIVLARFREGDLHLIWRLYTVQVRAQAARRP